jgi:hypothetical protein
MGESYQVTEDGERDDMWTINGPDTFPIGTSWADRETANDICDLMNMAYTAGYENAQLRFGTS